MVWASLLPLQMAPFIATSAIAIRTNPCISFTFTLYCLFSLSLSLYVCVFVSIIYVYMCICIMGICIVCYILLLTHTRTRTRIHIYILAIKDIIIDLLEALKFIAFSPILKSYHFLNPSQSQSCSFFLKISIIKGLFSDLL